jgi:hypothetical protein
VQVEGDRTDHVGTLNLDRHLTTAGEVAAINLAKRSGGYGRRRGIEADEDCSSWPAILRLDEFQSVRRGV